MNDHVDSLATSTADYTYTHGNVLVQLTVAYKPFYLISTDKQNQYDYTGVRVWPGAELLCQWLIQQDLHSTSVIELGSGVGLCGLLCSKLSGKQVTLSDCNDASIHLLKHNIAINNCSNNTDVIKLLWSKSDALSALNTRQYDLVIASDIVYPDTSEFTICDLFDTVDIILSCQPVHASDQFNQCFILSYFVRSHVTTQLLFDTAARHEYSCDILVTKQSADIGYVLRFNKQPSVVQTWHKCSPFIDICCSAAQVQQQDELYADLSDAEMLKTQFQFD